jgi:uncharacterized protein (TIGR02996 family)
VIPSDELALRAACRAAPDDDLPRLVYADWLEEHGRADLAALIRAQCELERLPKTMKTVGPVIARYEALRTQEAALIPAVESALPVRTRRAVEADQRSVRGCCDRHADNQSCDCLERAVDLTWDRGFAVVRCGLADWIGEPCERCNGTGTATIYVTGEYSYDYESDCPDCAGGEQPSVGFGRLIVPVVPMWRVEVADRTSANHGGWWWYAENEYDGGPTTAHLPGAVFDRLPAECDYIDSDMCIPFKKFDTQGDAEHALSLAVISLVEHPDTALPPGSAGEVPARTGNSQGD